MGKLMLRTKGDAEFDRWWKDWASKRTQNRVVVEPRASSKKPGADVERTANEEPGQSGPPTRFRTGDNAMRQQ
jgi:hypothetical protein